MSDQLTHIETTTNPSAARSAAGAERMRAHRQRRREGLRCITLEIRDSEVDALVRRQLLKPERRSDPNAIVDALYVFLDRALDG
ncbi:MAG TPA: hypothetical protein VGV62_07640 [Xanthobacteraceae bacterium]|nr:hypothetical protein [Xanthobacteraceae bacterium]